MNMKLNIKNRLHAMPIIACLLGVSVFGLTSCDDFFELESEYVIFDGDNALDNASDTIYSVIGVLNKMQAIADRTVLLGEVRADLVDVTNATNADLRDLAHFKADADNKYNNPRDYYAVINNANYFIAMADTSLRNNRNEQIFIREYAAVKAFRAWTYMQLALNYGSVPFVTEPILTKEDSEKDYPRMDIQGICNYFISDLTPLIDVEQPLYGTIRSVDSRFVYFPISILLGEMNLWLGNYKDAALNYYHYISNRNGLNSTYPIGTSYSMRWYDSDWTSIIQSSGWLNGFVSESYSQNSELITMIPGDSIPSEGYYSELRNLFNSTADNDYEVSLTPSAGMQEISDAQTFCYVERANNGTLIVAYPPANVDFGGEVLNGDFRLYNVWEHEEDMKIAGVEKPVNYQEIGKFGTRNVHIYRRTMVYMRMAEALNRAGYPLFAYKMLATGVNNSVIDSIIPHYQADSTFLRQFDFPNTRYVLSTIDGSNSTANTMGIHDRGSGWSEYNEYYQMPDDTLITDPQQRLDYQIEKVEDMLVDEYALEMAFEGVRFYDLMRVAMRRDNPAYLADRVYARRGQENAGTMRSEIGVNLYDPNNWYLHWNGEIGIEPTGTEE